MSLTFLGLTLLCAGSDQEGRTSGPLGLIAGLGLLSGFIYAFFVAKWWTVLLSFVLAAMLAAVFVVLLRRVISSVAIATILIPVGTALLWFGLLNPSDGVLL